MKSLLCAAIGAVFGAVLETLTYLAKRRGEKMMDLIDDLIEKLEKLCMMYEIVHPLEPDNKETLIAMIEARHAFARFLRRRSFFWQKEYNNYLFEKFKNIEKINSNVAIIDDVKKTVYPDPVKTCAMRRDAVRYLIDDIDRVFPLV